MATKSSFYSNTGTTTNNIASITSLSNEATASKDAAAVSATSAAASASASEVSNAAALVSKNAAATSASTATTKADLATSNGATQVALATAQVVLATEQKTLSIAQAALATTKADNAATSATAASSSQNSATASASTATTKANEAAASAASAAASLDLFTDQYLGSKSSAPSVDNDGDALTSGDIYYDSTAEELRYYNGSAWVTAYIAADSMAALSGATFTGNVTVPNLVVAGSGTVDGRDVSVDGAKLDGIEASATADQTNAEIRAAVEAATDSNVFSDADHTKLNGVASSANNYVHPNHSGDVVSTADGATVIQVDAVDIPMLSATGTASSTTFLRGDNAWVTPTDTNTTYSIGDGGLTQNNFTNTLKTKLDGIEASATADQTNAEIRAAVEAATDSNVFTDADHTKLNAVPASIDEAGTAVAMAIALG